MATIYGTHWFSSIKKAREYYGNLGYGEEEISAKLLNEEICVGIPRTAKNEKLLLNREEGRYFIEKI